MKQKILFFLILGIVILVLGGYGYFKAIPGVENQTTNSPKIEITPKSFDFGEIVYGETAEYVFKVKNTGKEVLEIRPFC